MNSIVFAGILISIITAIPVFWQLKSHPPGLKILFFTEMWERFSYYGMRGLLIFYLTEQFLFNDKAASAQYGAYTTLVYLLTLIGGIVADRYLGARKAVAFGALLLVFGHLTMAVEGAPSIQTLTYQHATYDFVATGRGSDRVVKLKVADGAYAFGPAKDGGLEIKDLPATAPLPHILPKGAFQLGVVQQDPRYLNFLYAALALIVMGVGFLKATASSLVGQLYSERDPRRDPGFTLYYYGINLGSFWAAILCGWLGERFGWAFGFGAAGLGMFLGFIVFTLGRPLLQGKGEPPDVVLLKRPIVGPLNREHLIYLAALIGAGVMFLVLRHSALVGALLGLTAASVLGYVLVVVFRQCDRKERDRVFLALTLVAGATIFWTLFEQAGSSMNLFAQRNVNLNLIAQPTEISLFGRQVLFAASKVGQAAVKLRPDVFWIDTGMTAAQTQSFGQAFILLFAPLFAACWAILGRIGRDPAPLVKFGLGLIQVGLGFLVLVYGARFADGGARTPLMFLGLAYLLHATGELCISPVGLSQITKLAPSMLISTLMAVWFLSNAMAQYIGGMIAAATSTETVAGQVLDPKAALATSLSVFQTIGWVGVGAGLLFLALNPFLRRWSHGADATTPKA